VLWVLEGGDIGNSSGVNRGTYERSRRFRKILDMDVEEGLELNGHD
jgi:hypothetical protein